MADFCAQCAEWLALPESDFIGMISEEEVLKGMGVAVLCEGCGPIMVDHLGRCVTADCLRKHGLEVQRL